MQRFVTTLAALTLSATAAFAGGRVTPVEPIVQPPAPAAQAFNWTGAYAGLGIGAIRQSDTARNGPGFVLAPARGGQVSGLLGYNWQGAGPLVLGAEVMIAGGSVRGSAPCANPAFVCATSMGTTAALRLRLGMAQDRTLVFVTAGLARAEIRHSTEAQPFPGLTAVSLGRNGVTMGIGVEQAMAQGWNLRGEIEGYRFRSGTYTLDFGSDYSASRGVATAARLTLVRRF
jgi:outer membrane immunogenic protein